MREAGLPLRLPRHRERPRRGPRVPARARRRTRSARAGRRSATPPCRPSSICIAHGMYVVGGLIVGNPDDTRESIEANLDVRAPLRGLAVHPASDAVSRHADDEGLPRARSDRQRRVEEYDGTTAVVRTEHLAAEDVEFMRWRAERWMKVRHMPASAATRGSCCGTAEMLAHTFRGSWRSARGPRKRARGVRALQAIRRMERQSSGI